MEEIGPEGHAGVWFRGQADGGDEVEPTEGTLEVPGTGRVHVAATETTTVHGLTAGRMVPWVDAYGS